VNRFEMIPPAVQWNSLQRVTTTYRSALPSDGGCRGLYKSVAMTASCDGRRTLGVKLSSISDSSMQHKHVSASLVARELLKFG
jgi:hypothetical protein